MSMKSLADRCETAGQSLQQILSTPDFDELHFAQLASSLSALESLSTSVTKCIVALHHEHQPTRLSQEAENAAMSAIEASASLFKQFGRIDATNVQNVNSQYWTALSVFLAVNSRLFSLYTKLAHINNEEEQNSLLEEPATREATIQTTHANERAASCPDIFAASESVPMHTPNMAIRSLVSPPQSPPAADDALPPSYEESSSSAGMATGSQTPQTPQTPQESSSSWFSAAMTAATSNWRCKPAAFMPAFCEAIARGDFREMHGFINAGVNFEGLNQNKDTPLKTAIQTGRTDIVEVLLRAGVNPSSTVGRGLPPLFLAASLGYIKIAEMLHRRGAKVDSKDICGQYHFATFAAKEPNLEGLRFLLDHGADPCVKEISSQMVLATSVQKNHLEIVRMLLEKKAGANSCDVTTQPLIAIAVHKNNLEMASLLLSKGANPNALDITGAHVLSHAVVKSYTQMIQLLLSHGAIADARDVTRVPVLVHCVVRRHIDTARLLLEHGATPNVEDLVGVSVLVTAISDTKIPPKQKLELVGMLLEKGAWTQSMNLAKTANAMKLAKDTGDPELIALMESHGAYV